MNDSQIATGSGKRRRYHFSEPDVSPHSSNAEDTGSEPKAPLEPDLRDRLFKVLARGLNSLLYYSDFNDTILRTLELLGTSTGMDRVYIFENSTDPDTGSLLMSQRFEWSADRASAQIDNPELQNLPYETSAPRLASLLKADLVYKEIAGNFTPSERKVLEPQGIQSIIIAPIRIEDQLWGFVGFDDCHRERDWTQSEESILRVAAAGIGNVIRRRQAEESLRNSEAIYQTFFETTQSVVLLLTPDARLMSWNSAAEKLFGYSREEVIGKSYLELFVQDKDQAEVRNSILRIMEGKDCRNVETKVRSRDGAIRTLLWNVTRLPEGKALPRGLVAFGQDITERSANVLCRENSDTADDGTPSLQPATERILLMDDEESVREITGQILTHLGYVVELAANGEEAVALFSQAESTERHFSHVMLDLTIRGGMGGFKTLQKLREIDPEVRAIIVSGYTNDPVVEFFDTHGFNASLTKPFTIKQLQTALANSKT